jgi:hypothetical protein
MKRDELFVEMDKIIENPIKNELKEFLVGEMEIINKIHYLQHKVKYIQKLGIGDIVNFNPRRCKDIKSYRDSTMYIEIENFVDQEIGTLNLVLMYRKENIEDNGNVCYIWSIDFKQMIRVIKLNTIRRKMIYEYNFKD